jgi:hypothetical protein
VRLGPVLTQGGHSYDRPNRLKMLSILDAEIFTYTHVVCLKDRQDVRLVKAFLDVIKLDDL